MGSVTSVTYAVVGLLPAVVGVSVSSQASSGLGKDELTEFFTVCIHMYSCHMRYQFDG